MSVKRWKITVVAAALSSFALSAHAISCMVLGEHSARVQSFEGEKSPVFLTSACESLRLISGKAMVSWVSRDGKPHFAPIAIGGPALLPTAGAEERSANVVWAELTSKREVDRPAFMRAMSEERPSRVYIPPEGLTLTAKPDADFSILLLDGNVEKLIFDKKSSDKRPILLTRDLIKAGGTYLVEWHHGANTEKLRWQAVDSSETARIDSQYDEIRSRVDDVAQRRIMMSMVYEQLRLRVNMTTESATP